MKNIKIVLQCEGAAQVLVGDFNGELSVGEALAALGAQNIGQGDQLLFAEDRDGPVDLHTPVQTLASGKREGGAAIVRLHQGRCPRVTVNVTFNGVTQSRDFPPVTRVAHVHQWATHNVFDMSPRDAAEHVLELVGSDERPDPDTQIGTLTSGALCAVAFDLVPFKRVEG
ncbi:hypothetical protein LF41_1754 [Lysobacter dokdonensis DS-58]|uniref:Uncharacterized protein n=1 Tax=Lysobacter dokdonensis DS-58 TaxID=1300345 RepID=A0A0A2WI11_9GAMM|nr:hypothetical protein [Lysobacter dokdonensis]KGQ17900.1 hypothetical protein LF41_1754 [Lysobacter dokdonensis DS-58]